jgi:hypothetical protein
MPFSRALKDVVRNVQARAAQPAGMGMGGGLINRIVNRVRPSAPTPASPVAGLTPKGGTLAGRVMRSQPPGKTPLSAPVATQVGAVASPYSRNLGGTGVRRTIKRPMGGVY